MSREFNHDIMSEIIRRWSPRAFDSSKKPEREEILSLIEAARFSPSCFNEQPWRYLIADEGEDLDKLRSVLTDSNRIWAGKAPVLIMVLSKKTFDLNGDDNYWNMFDAGCSWGFLSLEATRRGMITHAMGGLDKTKAMEIFNISKELIPIAVIAVGYYGDKEDLPEDLKEREHPGDRKSIDEILL